MMLNVDNEINNACLFCSILGFTCMYIYIYIYIYIYTLQFYFISFKDGETKTGLHWNICCCFSHIVLSYSLWPPWTAAHQASLSFAISHSLPKFMSIASEMLSSHLILWCPLLLLPSIFPSIRDFSSESTDFIRWQKYWSLFQHLSVLPRSI